MHQVLHTGRGGGQQGRYQSPALSLQGVTGFIHEFNTYLSSAGRFDRWQHSPGQQATVLWDRHNLLNAHGPPEDYAPTLRALGFSHGEPQLPVPDTHH
nr:hypothetical protein FFPRI1PSEUD_38510 [Pseudomonas sp. FFPRI_1]